MTTVAMVMRTTGGAGGSHTPEALNHVQPSFWWARSPGDIVPPQPQPEYGGVCPVTFWGWRGGGRGKASSCVSDIDQCMATEAVNLSVDTGVTYPCRQNYVVADVHTTGFY